MMTSIYITVDGVPQPQGSKAYKGMRGGRAVLIESAKGLPAWRAAVVAAAREAISEWQSDHGTEWTPLDGPLSLRCVYSMPRPKAHYRADGSVKPGAPDWCHMRPDLDKLLRAIGDALTEAGVWVDDSRVARIVTNKGYVTDRDWWRVGVDIEVQTLAVTA